MSSIRAQSSSNFSGAGKRNFYYAPMGQSGSGDSHETASGPVDMSTILLRQPFSPAEIKIVEISHPGSNKDNHHDANFGA